MIADLDEMELTDGKRAIQIDQSLINQISFIKEGEFIEKSGSPALRLVGDVTAANPTQIVRKGVITRADMLQDFLADKCLGEPLDYIRFAVESTFGDWLPIRILLARQVSLIRISLPTSIPCPFNRLARTCIGSASHHRTRLTPNLLCGSPKHRSAF
jgi:hypothetical protein